MLFWLGSSHMKHVLWPLNLTCIVASSSNTRSFSLVSSSYSGCYGSSLKKKYGCVFIHFSYRDISPFNTSRCKMQRCVLPGDDAAGRRDTRTCWGRTDRRHLAVLLSNTEKAPLSYLSPPPSDAYPVSAVNMLTDRMWKCEERDCSWSRCFHGDDLALL